MVFGLHLAQLAQDLRLLGIVPTKRAGVGVVKVLGCSRPVLDQQQPLEWEAWNLRGCCLWLVCCPACGSCLGLSSWGPSGSELVERATMFPRVGWSQLGSGGHRVS